MDVQISSAKPANPPAHAAYRAAPFVGAALVLAAVGVAPFVWWLGFVLAVAGSGVAGGAFWKLAADERRVLGVQLEDVGVQNRDLWQHAQALEAAKRESNAVLGAVRAHLMLVDSSYLIQNRYSCELEGVFRQRELGNENFLNVLQRLLSERMFKTARDYLGMFFDLTRKERVLLKVNPLDEVEVTAANADGSVGLRYLNFDFKRLLENGVISRVLVTVEDRTERVFRERQLRESEAQKVKQFELLIGILHVEPDALDGFVEMAEDQLALVDQALNASDFTAATTGQTALLRQRLDIVLQRVHNIKGNASLLALEHFEKLAQDFEQKIIDLKHRSALGGDDFLTVVIGLAAFRADIGDLQSLRVKLAAIQRAVRVHDEVGDDLIGSLEKLVTDLGAKLGKDVKLDAEGFDSRKLPPAQRKAVKDVLIALTRNSLVHGIESPAERASTHKARIATIEIHPTQRTSPGAFAFSFRDDGRGLDAAKIRARAVNSGLLSVERARSVDDSEIAGFIFAPGFTTADETTTTAGRGMGMNIVKERIVDDCGGEIGVDSQAGRFCEFSFVLPAHAAALAASPGAR